MPHILITDDDPHLRRLVRTLCRTGRLRMHGGRRRSCRGHCFKAKYL